MSVAALGAALAVFALAAPAAAVNPPGNNGTIKIDGQPWDTHPNNEPHPGCIFQVDFYGFDEGDLWADVIFEAHPPTGSGVLLQDRVFIGEDDNSGGGSERGHDATGGTETDPDGNRYYDLSSALAAFQAHPQQGYHVKLTIHAEGSQGADVKHKVFWIDACETAPGDGETPNEVTTGGGQTPTEITTGGGVQGGRGTRPGESGFGGALPNTAVAGQTQVGTGLLMLGVAVALGGAAAAWRMRGVGERAR